VDYNGIGGAGDADALPDYQDNLISDLSPFATDNIVIHYLGKLTDIFRNWLATRYYAIMQTHLATRTLVGA
jgi:hypothetical protein